MAQRSVFTGDDNKVKRHAVRALPPHIKFQLQCDFALGYAGPYFTQDIGESRICNFLRRFDLFELFRRLNGTHLCKNPVRRIILNCRRAYTGKKLFV